jgi:hypothetical protein
MFSLGRTLEEPLISASENVLDFLGILIDTFIKQSARQPPPTNQHASE